MLGKAISMALPEVAGVEVVGHLCDDVTPTEMVRFITEQLRRHGVVDKLVELAKPELLQELDGRVEWIRGNPHCSRKRRVVCVHELAQGVPRNARSFRSMKARSSGLAPAPAGCPQSDGIGASVTFRIHLLSWRASPSGK